MPENTRDSIDQGSFSRDFGPYRIVRRLGIGGMAETYEAVRRGPSGFAQRVCLKLVLPFFREHEDFVRLFEREAKLAARLRHRNIVGVIDFGNIEGTYYMALELVDGIDLQGLLEAQGGKKLSHELVALLGHELTLALEHAHNPPPESGTGRGITTAIVHRDISPSNVLISRQGEVFLADFGVAKAVSGASHKHSGVKGKIPYMPPEQLRARECDGRADLFSLGVVLFEALAGERPYDGGNDPATIMKILNGDHPSLVGLSPGAPEPLRELIEQLIEPDVEDRPQSASELRELFEDLVPAPRVQRELGRMVAELRPEQEPDEAFLSQASMANPVHPKAATEALSGLGAGEGAPSSGVVVGEMAPSSGIVSPGEGSRIAAAQENGTGPAVDAAPAPPIPSGGRRTRAAVIVGLLLGTFGVAALWWSWSGGLNDESDLGVESPAPAQPVRAEPAAAPAVPAQVAPPEEAPKPSEEPPTEVASEEAVAPPSETASPPSAATKRAGDTEKKAPPPKARRTARLTVAVFPWGYVWVNGKRRGRAPLKDLALKPGTYEIGAGKEAPTVVRSVRLAPGDREVIRIDLRE